MGTEVSFFGCPFCYRGWYSSVYVSTTVMLMASILSYYDKGMGIGILFISVGFTVNTVFIAVFNHAPISKDIQCFDTNETNNMAEKNPEMSLFIIAQSL